ncbi:hypothetical protein [Burkholderia cenocepacia]|uniref:hypothetical protein n=1 Tax=Burkholderia cenocepacia TaxID=95486 RepID=UPI001B9D4D9D|nr:hypothetical protein [Burkholderia cenocepacia]MBR7945442.1 hypothetical protein [Burkholderia cenocepacia]
MATTEERLEKIAGEGVAVLTIPQLAQAIGLDGPGAVQSIRNRVAGGTFPIPSRKNGKARVFSIKLVADWIDGNDEPEPEAGLSPQQVQVRKVRDGKIVSSVGRPTNAMRAERLKRRGMAYAQLLVVALDDWWRDYQAREAGTLGDAVDEAIDAPLPPYNDGGRLRL